MLLWRACLQSVISNCISVISASECRRWIKYMLGSLEHLHIQCWSTLQIAHCTCSEEQKRKGVLLDDDPLATSGLSHRGNGLDAGLMSNTGKGKGVQPRPAAPTGFRSLSGCTAMQEKLNLFAMWILKLA